MTPVLVWFVFLTLIAVAAIHAFWALGGLWPGNDEKTLAKAVVGSNGIEQMPLRWITGLVTVCIVLAAIWPMVWLGWIDIALPGWFKTLGMVVLWVVFMGRGLGGFLPVVRKMNSEEPFATLDRKYFSPLILALGFCFSYLLITHAWSSP